MLEFKHNNYYWETFRKGDIVVSPYNFGGRLPFAKAWIIGIRHAHIPMLDPAISG